MAKQRKRKVVRKKKKQRIDPFKTGFWRSHWKEALILALVSLGLYAMSIPYEFVLDDQIVISDNDFTKKGIAGIGDIFGNDSFTGYFGEQKDLVAGARYRPLSLAMFAVEYEIAGLNPRIHHIVNLITYAFLILLTFRVLNVLLPRHKPTYWFLGIPFIAALLFAVHPVHTEAVANIKGRDEILAMLGAMGALYAVLRFAYRDSKPWLISSALIFFAGMMAKENTITFLAVMPLSLYFFTEFKIRRWVLAVTPALIATIAYIAVRVKVIGFLFSENTSTDLLNNPFLEMNGAQKAATIMYTLGEYVRLLIFPHPLTHDYYPYHVPIMEWSDAGTLISLCIYLILGVLALLGLRKKWVLSFGILYFLATLSIVSNVFFPIGTFMNERFAFMPSLAFCFVAAYYGYTGREKYPKLKWILPGLIALYFIGFTGKSLDRIPAWKDTFSLNQAGIKVSHNSARANCFMGTALYNEAREMEDREERYKVVLEADAYVNKSLAMIPAYLSANQMKSGLIAEHYRYDRDLNKLLRGFEEVLARKANVEYIQQYSEYLNNRGRDVDALLNFYYRAGYEILSKQSRRYDFAAKYINYGLSLDPNNALLNWAMGKNYQAWGNANMATTHLNKAYQMDPTLRQRE